MTDAPMPSSPLDALADASERDLLASAARADADATLALIDRYAPVLFNLLLRTTGLVALAEELTRDVLADALRQPAAAVPPPDGRWIVALAKETYRRLLAIDLRPDEPTHRVRIAPRYWQPERLQTADDDGLRPATARAARLLRRRLGEAWSRLAMRQRFVLALVEPHRLSTDELADVLDESEPVARQIRDEAKLALLLKLPRPSDARRREAPEARP